VSATYAPQANSPGVKLANAIISQYAPTLSGSLAAGDSNVVYGLSVGWTFVYALQHAGKNPTRVSLMKALKNLNVADPFTYPGIKLQTSAKDNFPIEQEVLIKWSGGATGDWTPFGSLYNHVR